MSYADQVFRRNCEDILKNGVWDTELAVRPRWEDGTPAHTVKKFGIVNRYDLQREFPILTLRRLRRTRRTSQNQRTRKAVVLTAAISQATHDGIGFNSFFCRFHHWNQA